MSRERRQQLQKILIVLVAVVSLGLMEAAWTGTGRGGPVNTYLGCFAILILLVVVTWPKIYFIPTLVIFEEWIHLIFGYGIYLPTYNTLFNHWSSSYLGFNIYPWITFPTFSICIYLMVRYYKAKV